MGTTGKAKASDHGWSAPCGGFSSLRIAVACRTTRPGVFSARCEVRRKYVILSHGFCLPRSRTGRRAADAVHCAGAPTDAQAGDLVAGGIAAIWSFASVSSS
jgi:hypothetical protein